MLKNILPNPILNKKITNYSLNLEQMWKLWCLALGEKASKKNNEADYVAIVRSIIFLSYLVTNIFIISGVVRHWNDETKIYIKIDGAKLGKPL